MENASQSDDNELAEKAEWKSLLQRLQQNDPSLEEVDAGSANLVLDEERLFRLTDALRLHQIGTIRRVHLRNIRLPRKSAASTILAPALKNLHTLESLSLSDCSPDENDDTSSTDASLADALGVALFYNPSIASLSCSHCWRNHRDQPTQSPSLLSILHTARHLTELRLVHNYLDARAAQRLAQAVRHTPSLQRLDLTGNHMSDTAVTALMRGFQRGAAGGSRLQTLILDFNAFGDAGVASLARFLTTSSSRRSKRGGSLTELHLFGNRVSCVGAQHLAAALRVNATLQSLVLSFNQIGDEGVVALAQALTINTTLTKMWFPSNAIGCDGMLSFAEHLPRMKGLEQLNVGLLLHEQAAKALAAAVQCNMRLSVLHMEQVPEEENEQATAQQMDFYLRLNRSGRRLLQQSDGGAGQTLPAVPLGLWTHVLAKSSRHSSPTGAPDVLHYWIRAKPELMDSACRVFYSGVEVTP